jgi:hypothetical protein
MNKFDFFDFHGFCCCARRYIITKNIQFWITKLIWEEKWCKITMDAYLGYGK